MGGYLDIAIMKEPTKEWNPSRRDRHLNVSISTVEWEALFFDSLGAPKWDEYPEPGDIHEYLKRQKEQFQSYLSERGYVLLGRIWRIYRDVEYLPFEINDLRSECLSVDEFARDIRAKDAIRKLISACDEALSSESGVVLLSD